MKSIKYALVLVVVFTSTSLFAQSSLDTLLTRVENRNPTLQTAQSLLESRKLNARTGLTPANPEVLYPECFQNNSQLSVLVISD